MSVRLIKLCHNLNKIKMRITLHRLTLRDLYQLQSIVKQDIAHAAQIEWPFNKTVAENFIVHYNTWGVYINGGVLAGAVEVKESLETAYFVAQQYQGSGIATIAVRLCISEFGDKQLWCVIDPKNTASMRVAQKANLRIKFI